MGSSWAAISYLGEDFLALAAFNPVEVRAVTAVVLALFDAAGFGPVEVRAVAAAVSARLDAAGDPVDATIRVDAAPVGTASPKRTTLKCWT